MIVDKPPASATGRKSAPSSAYIHNPDRLTVGLHSSGMYFAFLKDTVHRSTGAAPTVVRESELTTGLSWLFAEPPSGPEIHRAELTSDSPQTIPNGLTIQKRITNALEYPPQYA